MPDWLTKDFHWKAFSLLMAIGIWLTVRRASETPAAQAANLTRNTYANVPVMAVSAGANVHQAQIIPQTVTAIISGPPEVMDRLQRDEIHAQVNLTDFSSAQNLAFDVEISLPPGTTVVGIDPPSVTVTLPKQP